ncbi:MAG: hypothetical protein MHMPM18_001262 [Marteilia pararefringens]
MNNSGQQQDQLLELEFISDESSKVFKAQNEGNFQDNANYFVLCQKDSNRFDMIPVNKWMRLKPVKRSTKPISLEEAESYIQKRTTNMDRMAILAMTKSSLTSLETNETQSKMSNRKGSNSSATVRRKKSSEARDKFDADNAGDDDEQEENDIDNVKEGFIYSSDSGISENSDQEFEKQKSVFHQSKSDDESDARNSDLDLSDSDHGNFSDNGASTDNENFPPANSNEKSSANKKESASPINSSVGLKRRGFHGSGKTSLSGSDPDLSASQLTSQQSKTSASKSNSANHHASKRSKTSHSEKNNSHNSKSYTDSKASNAISIEIVRQILTTRPTTVSHLLKHFTDRKITIGVAETKEITSILKLLKPEVSIGKDGKTKFYHLKK